MRIVALLSLFAIAGCAGQKAAPPSLPAASTPPAESASAPAGKKPITHIDETNIEQAQAEGYYIVKENGARLYCRRDPVIGTRLRSKTTCLTTEQWRQAREAGKRTVRPALTTQAPTPPGGQ
jgi:hypothetical protein